MSHNYPYRNFPLPSQESQPDRGTHGTNAAQFTGNAAFYRQPLQTSSRFSPSPSYPMSSSSQASAESSYSNQNPAHGILHSYGLKSEDLSKLVKLPNDVLNMETIPYILKGLKDSKEKTELYSSEPYSSVSHIPGTSRLPAASSTDEWDQIQSMHYPLEHVSLSPKPIPAEKVSDWEDQWGELGQNDSIACTHLCRTESLSPPSSSLPSSSYIVDYGHKERLADYTKREDKPPSRYQGFSYSLERAEADNRMRPPHDFQSCTTTYKSEPPKENYNRMKHQDRDARFSSSSSSRSSSRSRLSLTDKTPCRKAARDFHGVKPEAYPYSCSLCDITVFSDKFWNQHINGSQHADAQLVLLQKFPDWDCRMESIPWQDLKRVQIPVKALPLTQGMITDRRSQRTEGPSTNKQPISPGNSKVVCAKFEAQSIDEHQLRQLTAPFGKLVKVLMFPSLAFVEMGSSEQVRDLVKYYSSNPATVQGNDISFYQSTTFNTLQSSRVLSYTPAPQGEDGVSDLIKIIKRFGSPLYTLFLPSVAFIEMKFEDDAKKIVNHYSSNTLEINNEVIKVDFSVDHSTLMRLPFAKRYKEESPSKKRTRSPSPRSREREKEEEASKKSRRSSGEGERSSKGGERKSKERSSREGERSSREGERSSREGEGKTTERSSGEGERKSKERSSGEGKSKQSSREGERKSGEGEKSRDQKSREGEKKSGEDESKEKSCKGEKSCEGESKSQMSKSSKGHSKSSQSSDSRTKKENAAIDKAPPTESKTELPWPGLDHTAATQEESELSGEESDIEGMKVIGMDGASLEDTEEEGDLQQVKVEEEPEVEQKMSSSTETQERAEPMDCGSQPEQDTSNTHPGETEEEPDFSDLLENCITLDEVSQEECDEDDLDKSSPRTFFTRVIYFRSLPWHYYSDSDFLNIVKGYGKVTRYFLIRNRREGFIEMSSCTEAIRAARELNFKEFKGMPYNVQLSFKYPQLTVGWAVKSDSDSEEDKKEESKSSSRRSGSSSRRSERSSRSHTKSKSLEKKLSNRRSLEREEATEKPSTSSSKGKASTGPEEVTGSETTSTTAADVQSIKVEESERTQDGVQPEPGSGEPPKPVGAEFVRPVVGFFCNLCNVIYVEEDEAKTQHCSSSQHYRKYKEHTGKDPWAT